MMNFVIMSQLEVEADISVINEWYQVHNGQVVYEEAVKGLGNKRPIKLKIRYSAGLLFV